MLTAEQRATVKAYILATPDLASKTSGPGTDYGYISDALSSTANPAWYVWKTSAAADDIYDAITWANLTPADAPDGTALYTNRALLCQAKQINLQILLQGKQTLLTSKLKIRQALTDALQNIPAGAGGALLDAGWTPVKQALYRGATTVEKLLSNGTGTTGVPANLDYEGGVGIEEVAAILA